MGFNRELYTASEIAEKQKQEQLRVAEAEHRISQARHQIAVKVTMVLVDQIVARIIRPGPKPEERECYEMAGELRAIIPELEKLVKDILDVNDGVI